MYMNVFMWVIFVHRYSCWSLESILHTISKHATFLEQPHISSPAWSLPCLPWCSPQPANKKKKIRVKYFNSIGFNLSGPCTWVQITQMGAISCCETLAYFKYTPVKAKIKTIYFQYLFLCCHLQFRSHYCVCTNMSLQMIQVNQTRSISNTEMFLVKLSPWRPIGLWDIENLTLYRHSAHRWRRGCHPYAPTTLYSPETLFFYFCYRPSKPQGLEWPEGLGKFKNSPHLVSNLRSSGL
jgi:hypothetical protein